MTWVQEQSVGLVVPPNVPVQTATGATITFPAAPTEGNELICYAIARPKNVSTSTNVLSMAGWTKIRQEDTTSHSIAIFHKTAGPSEPTSHTLTATMTGDTQMSCGLRMIEVSGPAFGDVVIDEHSNSAGASVTNWSDSFTTPNADPHFVAAIFTIRQSDFYDLNWKAGEAPNNTFAVLETSNWLAHVGWEEYAAATTDTWGVQVSGSSAQAADVIVGWKQAPLGPTPPTYVSSTGNNNTNPVTVSTPAGSAGDKIIAIGSAYNTSANPQITGSAAFTTDFTKIGRTDTSDITTAIEAWQRDADGTEDASYALTISSDGYSGSAAMVRVTECQLQTTSGGFYSATTGHLIPAHTVDADGSLAILCATGYNIQATTSAYEADGWTRVQSFDGNFVQVFVKQVNAGAYSQVTTGPSDADSGSILVILEPVQGGGTPSGDASASFGFSSSTTVSGVRTKAVSSSWGFSTSTSNSTVRNSTASQSWGFTGIAESAPVASGSASLSWGFSSAATKDSSRQSDVSVSWGISASVTVEAVKVGVASLSWSFQTSVSNETTRAKDVTTSFGFTYGVTHNEVAVRSINFSWGFSESSTEDTVRSSDISSSWGFSGSATGAAEGNYPITDYVLEYRTTAGPGAWTPFTDPVTAVTGGTVTGLDPGVSYDFRVAAVNDLGQGPWSNIATATSGESTERSGDATASWGFSSSTTEKATKQSVGSVSFGATVSATADTVRSTDALASWGFNSNASSGSVVSYDVVSQWSFDVSATESSVRSGSAASSWGFSTTSTEVTSRNQNGSENFGFSTNSAATSEHNSTASHSWGFNTNVSTASSASGSGSVSWGFSSTASKETERDKTASLAFGFTASATGSASFEQSVSVSWGFSADVASDTVRSDDASASWGSSESATTSTTYSGDATASWGFSTSSSKATVRSSAATETWSTDTDSTESSIHATNVSFTWHFAAYATTSGTYSGNASASWGFGSSTSGTTVRSTELTQSWGSDTTTTYEVSRNGDASESWGAQSQVVYAASRVVSALVAWGSTAVLSVGSERSGDSSLEFSFSSWAYAGDTTLSSRVFLGSNRITPMYVGQNLVLGAYLGSNKVY